MGRFSEISQIYDAELVKLRNPQYWETTLKRTAAFWRLSFCEAMLLTAQNPKADMVASYDQWNMAGRRINRGEHSIGVFKNRNDTVLRYLFDITQTTGRSIEKKWQMSDDLADALTAMFNAAENSEMYPSFEDYIQSSIDNSLYAENSLQNAIEKNAMLADFVRKSAECICLTRCGIVRNYDFSDAAKFADDISIVQIGNAATEISQSVLQPIETAIRRKQYEPYRNNDNRNRYRLHREGRSILPEFSQLRTERYDTSREESDRPIGRNRPIGIGYDEYERTLSAHLEGDRSKSGNRALTDGRTSTETNITQQELTGASSTARSSTASSRTGSVGNSENVRKLAVTRDTFSQNAVRGGKNTSGNDELNSDSEEDWIHSSEYEEYSRLTEQIEYSKDSGYNKEATDENVASFFVDNDDSSEQVSLFDDNAAIVYPNVVINGSFNRDFNVADYGFEVNKAYSVEEFNSALRTANRLFVKDERFGDKLPEVIISIYADNGRKADFSFEIYANYSRLSEIMDIRPTIADTQTLSELQSAVAEAEIPTWEFISYACTVVCDDLSVQNAHENSGKNEFTLEVEKAVDDCYTRLIVGEVYDGYEIPPYEGDRVPFYNKYHQDSDYRSGLLSEIIEKVDKYLLEMEEGKRIATEIGMPFSTESCNSYEDFDPYAYDGSMSIEDSRKVANAHNLDELMSGYSDELNIAAAKYSGEEFEKFFSDKAAEVIRNTEGSWLNDMGDNPDYLKEVCKLVSWRVYNELRDNSRQAMQETAEAEKASAVSFSESIDEAQKLLNGTANRYNSRNIVKGSDKINSEEITTEEKADITKPETSRVANREDNMLMGRLVLDCKYYLKTGAEKHLWADTVEEHIDKMRELCEKFPDNDYFTQEDIDDYAEKMLAVKFGKAEPVLSEPNQPLTTAELFAEAGITEESPFAVAAQVEAELQVRQMEQLGNSEERAKNYHFPADFAYPTGAKAKYNANIAAIQTLKTIESENRTATPEEQAVLAKYAGWGGLPQAFDPANEQWSKEYKQLRELLTDEEYSAAAESTLNAHYTSPEVIKAIYKALENFGYKGGNLLEPALGTGRFFGCMPEEMQDSKLYGVELDSISGRIAKQLYPEADIQISGFEKTEIPDNFFDAAVGNVPFGNYGIADKRYDKEHFLVHDYFFAKTLDKVAPNGVVAFITSKGTLDKANPKVREYLAKRADLIGAIRLPNNAFKGANTEVTSDIIFLQKLEKMAVELPDWCYTAQNSDGISVNQYFIDHPEMVLGKLETKTGAFGQEITCSPIEGEKLSEQLDRAVSRLRAETKVQKRSEKREKERGIIPANADVRNFTHTIVDGKMYFRENNIMTEVKQTGKDLERMKWLHELRQTMRELIDAQSRSCSDEELHGLQQRLNTQYNNFAEKFGSINDRRNATVFRDDDDYNTLCSLENVNAEKKTVEKSDIFRKRTIKPVAEVTQVDTPQEAMQVAMDMRGCIDIPYMAQLCSREPQQIVERLIADNLIYLNPENQDTDEPFSGYEEAAEYLSGNVRAKLRTAERFAQDNPEYQRNVTALRSALPPTIEAGDISARIGASWVDVKDYEKFLTEYLGRKYSIANLRRTITGEYKLENKNSDKGVAATNTYGTEHMSAYHIFENLLNHRDITIKDRVYSGDGEYKYVINQKQTQLAAEKAKQMQTAFSKWLWENPQRREKYVARYNELFNSIVGRHYNGSHQTFPQMSPYIQLKPHQKDAVMRAKFGGNTLLAHCVGAGKSFEMIAATMEKKRLGLINKACVVVPKALVGQTANEWLRLYPQAKILVAGDNDFSKDNRQKFIGRCCTGDYAAVVMSYEQFEKIPMSTEYRRKFLEKELDTLRKGLRELDPYRDRQSVKDIQREQKRIKAKIEKLLDTAKIKDNSLTFEQLGFDSLVVDEAHNYKNGLVVSKMSNVSGVQTTAAQKSEDILMKTQYLNETYGTKNILFATGTPVTNSMTELYTMQRYLRPDLLQNAGLQTFDDWAGNFGEVVSQLEIKPAGDGFRTKKRFAKFTNLPELMQMYKEFADIRTAEMLKLPVPEIEGGKPQTIVAQPNEFQQAYVKVLAERSEIIHNGSVDPTQDNMLKVTHEARLLGLDARTINPIAENSPDSKVNLCIDKVMEIYNQTAEQKGVQAIFCDIAVNSDDGKFSVYDYIKEELQRRGIPKDELCTAGDANNQQQRNEIFAKLRSGEKRIVIASTSKLGTGANIQTRLAALHNLDIPWKPSDLEQRNGRIIRQGNTFGTVGVYNYVTENTFDSYMMNIIVTKQKFISQLMSGKTPARTCEDVDEMVLNYSEMQALATGDPRIKEKIELDGDVARLRTLKNEHYNNKYKLEDMISGRTILLSRTEQRLETAKSDKAFAQSQLEKSEDFSVKICGKMFTERKNASEVLAEEIHSCIAKHTPKEIGEYKGFEIALEPSELMTNNVALLNLKHGSSKYSAEVELENGIGNITRMENILKSGIDKEISACEMRIEQYASDIQTAKQTLEMPFEHAEELAEKSARLEQLNAELDCGKTDEVFLEDNSEDIEIDLPEITQDKSKTTHTRR